MVNSAILAMVMIPVLAPASSDWPRWRGPTGDGHIPRTEAVLRTLPAEPRVVWKAPAGHGSGSAVVSRGCVYYLDNRDDKEVLCAVRSSDGKALWAVPIDEVYADSGSPPGPRGTPTVDGERVYVGSCRGEFRCLKVADGSEVWRTSFVRNFGAPPPVEVGDNPGAKRHGYTASPLIVGNRLYVTVGGTPDAAVVCFEKTTGEVLWRSQDDIAGHAGPVLAAIAGVRQLVCFMAEAVLGLSPEDGRLLWRLPVRSTLGRHVTTPVIVGDTVVIGSHTSGLIGIRVSRSAAGLEAKQAWRDASLGVDFSSPVARDGYVYCIGPGGRLFCVDARSGARAWVQDGFFRGMLDAGFASFLVAGANLLILAERGDLLLVRASNKECTILARTKVCGRTWCTPAYSGGRLFVRANTELVCVEVLR